MLSEDDRRKRCRIWLSGTAALLAVAAAGVVWAVRHVPGDIAGRTRAALQTAGLDPHAAVTVEGRTVVLSGEVPDAYTRARMRAIAGFIRGVREVHDQLTVAPLRAHPLPPAAPAVQTAEREPSPAAAREAPQEIRTEAIMASPPDPPPDAAAAEPVPAFSTPPAPIYAARDQTPSDQPSAPPERPPVRSELEPAPQPPPARLQLPLLHFAFGSTRLTPESEPQLREIVEALRNRSEVRVELAGHADSVGPKSLNQRLSLQRARAVADRLVAAGIDGARLQTSGHCDSRPLMDNHTRKGRAMNRRVELILIQ
jgi:outer membrane protein OmpA-like peptidoglycan-associated protein